MKDVKNKALNMVKGGEKKREAPKRMKPVIHEINHSKEGAKYAKEHWEKFHHE